MAEIETQLSPLAAHAVARNGDGVARPGDSTLADARPADLVASELRHRFRNVVAMTQSLVNQTLRDGVSITTARETLGQRLAAMSRAVDLLVETDWQHGSLRTTVREALVLHIGFHDRIRCGGPEVVIKGDAVLALTLALHELGTNAVKYGALSVPEGTVDLTWMIVDAEPSPELALRWTELDGPHVAPPTRRGFGSRLVSNATGRALGGEASLEFNPSGVTWSLRAPLDRIGC